MTKTLDDVMKRILNDLDVFYIRYTIFDDTEWEELGEDFREGNLSNVTSRINQKIQDLKKNILKEMIEE